MRARVANTLLLLGSLFLVVLLVEGGYRVHLSFDLNRAREKLYTPDPNPSFVFYGWPPPWKFDARKGFSFSEGPWLEGRVVKGRFESCAQSGPGNQLGNFGQMRGRYEDAALKIAVFGSSYTLIDHGRNGDTTTNLLQEALSRRLGRAVHVLNFSRDATGLFTMFDIANDVLREHKPDVMLFTFNTTALGYRRHWRVVKQVSSDFYRMYFSRDATEIVAADRAIVHGNPITRRVTAEWCAAMAEARTKEDQQPSAKDPLLADIISEYRQIMRERTVPHIAIDFLTFGNSFVYNFLSKGDPYGGRKKLTDNSSFWEPLSVQSYLQDTRFSEAVEYVRQSRVPFELVHLPSLQEFRREVLYASGSSGLSDAEQLVALARVEELAGRRIVHLLDYYRPDRLSRPLNLVWSEADSHPSAEGVVGMAEAIERMLVDRGHVERAGTSTGIKFRTNAPQSRR